ncbi:alkaline phosphatase family protein [Mycobacterium yunnanensis]|uniref:Alkaline phosphatase family protein n=1 Tax=Mycobacterium yunnanensis TaxID=368477 RepID=A0A9X2ZAM2_9MYCO|nr:alkaline phosphatase D family protein [Mycobacterium yunnanensis]MCV7424794.1 alkaline phosphatase family protein [Mycobacterium yunnanensis]
MPLLLGPVLRHVGETSATVWVQTDSPGVVEVLGCSAPTFEVQGCHYGVVLVDGLQAGSVTEYQVHVDGRQMWPEPDATFPPSVIRTRGHDQQDRLQIIFGSCRYPKTGVEKLDDKLGLDALDVYAARLPTTPVDQWPDALVLLGDQVYADELTPEARRHLAGRRTNGRRPPDEVVSFTEYEGLYRHTWGDPEIRWILSTVPTAMIFDDHDIRDDWNTSGAWRREVNAKPWWRDRIRAGLASYWVYQHLGNLSPTELRDDEDYQKVLAAEGDVWPLLVDLADRADAEVDDDKGLRFSYRWDMGRSRLVMVDSRNARILDSGDRKMLGNREFAWLEHQVTDRLDDVDHLIVGSSLPWLLPPAIGDMQMVNERAANRPGRRGKFAETVRQAADFEHWAAFVQSFLDLSRLIVDVASRDADAPATVSVISGDVHHSYVARADIPSARSNVHQLVCSPVHNYVPWFVKPVFKLGWSRRLGRVTRRWAQRNGCPALPFAWSDVDGPLFGNTLATLRTSGRDAEAVFEQPRDATSLDEVARVPLTR